MGDRGFLDRVKLWFVVSCSAKFKFALDNCHYYRIRYKSPEHPGDDNALWKVRSAAILEFHVDLRRDVAFPHRCSQGTA
jgi:hypothetical protein